MLSNIKWSIAKFGFWLLSFWARDQRRIDGDWVQVEECLDSMLADLERG